MLSIKINIDWMVIRKQLIHSHEETAVFFLADVHCSINLFAGVRNEMMMYFINNGHSNCSISMFAIRCANALDIERGITVKADAIIILLPRGLRKIHKTALCFLLQLLQI